MPGRPRIESNNTNHYAKSKDFKKKSPERVSVKDFVRSKDPNKARYIYNNT
jgi:hypothetical protein